MRHYYFIAWPRIMKIGQIDVLFAVTRSKMSRDLPSFLPYGANGPSKSKKWGHLFTTWGHDCSLDIN